VPENYLEKFIKAFDEIPNLGSAQSKIILMNDLTKLDTCGSYWTGSSFLYHYGYGKNQTLEKYNKVMPFFSNKGASMMIRRDVVDKIGLFDDDFWCYYEETDFCHRLWLSGYESWYYPKAVCYHAMCGTSLVVDNSYIQFHNFKNKLLSFLKNFGAITLVKILPIYIFLNVGLSLKWLIQGKMKHFFAPYKAIWWNLVHLRSTFNKRKIIQSRRKKTDQEIFRIVKKNPRLRYYYSLLNHSLWNRSLQNYED
jgi:GT2 family glycosyltransferase